MNIEKLPSIFEFNDYRVYLKEVFETSQSWAKPLTHAAFAKIAGFKTPSIVYNIVTGRRNLSEAAARRIAKALQQTRQEAAFFESLVRYNQADSRTEQLELAAKLIRYKEFLRAKPLIAAQANFLSHWYYTAIKELSALPGFKADVSWIVDRLNQRVDKKEVQQALEDLEKLGILGRDSSGQMSLKSAHVRADDDLSRKFLLRFHDEMLVLAREALNSFSGARREMAALSFTLNQDDVPKLKEHIQKFMDALPAELSPNKKPDCAFQLNIQLFPLVTPEKGFLD